MMKPSFEFSWRCCLTHYLFNLASPVEHFDDDLNFIISQSARTHVTAVMRQNRGKVPDDAHGNRGGLQVSLP